MGTGEGQASGDASRMVPWKRAIKHAKRWPIIWSEEPQEPLSLEDVEELADSGARGAPANRWTRNQKTGPREVSCSKSKLQSMTLRHSFNLTVYYEFNQKLKTHEAALNACQKIFKKMICWQVFRKWRPIITSPLQNGWQFEANFNQSLYHSDFCETARKSINDVGKLLECSAMSASF